MEAKEKTRRLIQCFEVKNFRQREKSKLFVENSADELSELNRHDGRKAGAIVL